MNSNRFNCGHIFYVILILATIINDALLRVNACELDQTQHGCRIDNGACSCSYGCKSEFRYANLKECNDALKGRSNNVCVREPCQHGGVCIQISQSPGYRCSCVGTGYHGGRCHQKCPSQHDPYAKSGAQFPHECIVI
ncbi:protein crumbs-like [Sitodiplosis mosellana]|uniref:protein crumbs-like n=1 Tax=Sitodiplosis mosellana TaxID=263140 RepID=UPI002443E305|nr:protein crumbs-like [Sitodiplosis mosellana]